MINCPSCGAVNNEMAINCVACGDSLKLICPQCATHNALNALNCMQCGRILVDKSDVRIKQQVFNASLGKTRTQKKSGLNPLISPLTKVFLGALIFITINITKLLAGHFIWQFVLSLATGIITLWGLIELTFIILEASDITIEENFSQQIPPKPPLATTAPLEPFERTKVGETSAVSSPSIGIDIGETSEDGSATSSNIITVDEAPRASLDMEEFESLTEFLSAGIEKEITSTNKKLKHSPKNHALLMRLAQLYEEKNDIAKAIKTLERCIKAKPDVSEVYLYYGNLLKRNNNIKEAKKAFIKALEYNKSSSKTYYQLGCLEKSLNNFEEAKKLLQKSIQLSPDDPYAHYQLGMTYFSLKDNRLAIMELKRATTLHPTDSYGHSRLGHLYQITNQLDLAIASYSRALSIRGNDAYVIEKLAEVLVAKGDLRQGAEFYQESLAQQFHPQINTMIAYGRTLRKLEHYSELESLMTEVVRLSPENPEASFLRAFALIKLTKRDEAKEILEKLSENTGGNYEIWLELGKIYQEEGLKDKAIASFVKATTNAPNQAEIWNNIGILLNNQKAYEESVKAFRKAIGFDYTNKKIASNLKAVKQRLTEDCYRIIEARKDYLKNHPNDFEPYLDIGRSYEMLEMPLEALEAYKTFLEKEPQNVRGLMLYSELLTKNGQLKLAMRCYREILKIEPENIETHLYLVQANLSLGFINQALHHAKIAEKLDSENSMTRFLLGKVYLAKGLEPRALKEFTMVSKVSADPDVIAWSELMRRRLTRKEK